MHLKAKCLIQPLFQRLKQRSIKRGLSVMSRHPSYGKSSKSTKKQNVLKRFQRIDVLKKLGIWKEGQNKKVTGLPKTPVIK